MFLDAKQLSFVTTTGAIVQRIEQNTSNVQVEGSNPSGFTRKREYDNNYNEIDICAQNINGYYLYMFIHIFVRAIIKTDSSGCISKTDNNKSSLG